MDIDEFRLGKPFNEPESPEEMEFFASWFFARIKAIVSVENHVLKWRNVENVLELLDKAAIELEMNISFYYDDGFWSIDCGREEFLNLPLLAKKFGKLYRFQKRLKDDEQVEELNAGNYKEICRTGICQFKY